MGRRAGGLVPGAPWLRDRVQGARGEARQETWGQGAPASAPGGPGKRGQLVSGQRAGTEPGEEREVAAGLVRTPLPSSPGVRLRGQNLTRRLRAQPLPVLVCAVHGFYSGRTRGHLVGAEAAPFSS